MMRGFSTLMIDEMRSKEITADIRVVIPVETSATLTRVSEARSFML